MKIIISFDQAKLETNQRPISNTWIIKQSWVIIFTTETKFQIIIIIILVKLIWLSVEGSNVHRSSRAFVIFHIEQV